MFSCTDIGTATARLALAQVEDGRVIRMAKYTEIANLGEAPMPPAAWRQFSWVLAAFSLCWSLEKRALRRVAASLTRCCSRENALTWEWVYFGWTWAHDSSEMEARSYWVSLTITAFCCRQRRRFNLVVGTLISAQAQGAGQQLEAGNLTSTSLSSPLTLAAGVWPSVLTCRQINSLW